jgi:uncharacterized protein (TIGR01244 family)
MNAPAIQQIAPDVCVAGQLDPSAMAALADAGFKSVINNRPDYEGGPDQPTSAAIEAAAKAAGLRYAFLPVVSGAQTPTDVARMAQLVNELPKPLLAFCRTGTRSGVLYRAAVGA